MAEDNELENETTSGKGKKIAIAITLLMLLLVAGRVALQYKRNHEEGPVAKNPYEKPKLTDDQMVFPRKERPSSLKDEKTLIGKTVWVSAGGQLDYYPYAAHHADYAKLVGTLPGAEPLLVKDVFEQVAPKGRAVIRIPGGAKHVLLAFTLPKSANPKAEYATPVGNFEGGFYTFFSDEILYYDDPHELYKHWGPEMWAHIDKHEVVPGMSENQVMMSIGEVMRPSSDTIGDRTVTYDHDGHPVRVVFENNKATSITKE